MNYLTTYEHRVFFLLSLASSTFVENPLQISLFMQNKPNFQKLKMNVSSIGIMDYEKKTLGERGKNKPNQTQFLNLSGTGFKRNLAKMGHRGKFIKVDNNRKNNKKTYFLKPVIENQRLTSKRRQKTNEKRLK